MAKILNPKTGVPFALNAWEGASFQRPALYNFRPPESDPDTDAVRDLPTLRARSEDLYRNSPIGGGVITAMDAHVIGTGLTLRPEPDMDYLGWAKSRAERWIALRKRLWCAWAESTDCDLTRVANFYELQSLAFCTQLMSGDLFALLTYHDINGVETLAVQFIDSARVSNPDFEIDTDTLRSGIRLDRNGCAVGYYVRRKHPNAQTLDAKDKFIWDYVPARSDSGRLNVIHMFERYKPGQTRGVPILAPVIEPLKQLTRLSESELHAAVMQAAFGFFIRMDPVAFQELFAENPDAYLENAAKWDGSFPQMSLDGPSKAVNLLPGEEPVPVAANRPNEKFAPFFDAIVRQIGARVGIPGEVLIKRFEASFSASQAALLEAGRMFAIRRERASAHFCDPIAEAHLEWDILNNRIQAPGFFSDPLVRRAYCKGSWIGDGIGAINPKDAAEAAKIKVDMGISTLDQESILLDGIPWEDKHKQRVIEQEARIAANLIEDPAMAQKPTPQ